MNEHLHHFLNLQFTVVATVEIAIVRIVVYDIVAFAANECPLWHRAGSTEWPDPVDTLKNAEPYLHGDVRMDGVSNWYFDEQDRNMLYSASREDLARLGAILMACWDLARELMVNPSHG